MTTATIHFLECGQGDTTLLRIRDKWVLIDCHLPNVASRKKFLAETAKLKIKRLDAIFLSHPHDDHWKGLLEVIKHFTTGGRSVGYFCDGGLNPKLVRDILKIKAVPSIVSEYVELYQAVYKYDQEKIFEHYRCDKNSNAIISDEGNYSLFPIGPSARAYDAAVLEALEEDNSRIDLNELSLILFLEAKTETNSLDVLLAADADGSHVNDAMAHLLKRKHLPDNSQKLDIVKIPHHGSLASHKNCIICGCIKNQSNSIAVVSVGTKFAVLPDKKVMGEYLDAGWKVLLTTKRIGLSRKTRVLSVASKSRRPAIKTQKQNVVANWDSKGLQWIPSVSSLAASELSSYQTASK